MAGHASPEDADEIAEDCISPNPDVFSYFTLTAPNEMMKHRRFTLDACMSYVLVFVVLVMQAVLLFCVYQKVILQNADWHHGIMNTGGNAWSFIKTHGPGCNDGSSLCTLRDGVFTCAPPSVQLIGRWDELDTNKDGTWTKNEAMESKEAVQCKYGVDPVEVFGALVALLRERSNIIWIHPDVKNHIAIKKTYFTYILGDVAMCTYRNADMCANLVQKGVFDAPLRYGGVPRVGRSFGTALDYCRSMLSEGGLCQRVLPSAYRTWQTESVQECGAAKFSKFVYEHPGRNNTSTKSLLAVDYKARQNYEMAKTATFMIYKICILFIWLLLIVSQLREVGKTLVWVATLPRPGSHKPAATEGCPINDMSIVHRVTIFTVTGLRIFMLCILAYVGTNFLGRQTDYTDLLLDGVALLFIVEIEKILYERVLRQEVRSHWENRHPIEVHEDKATFTPDVSDMVWLLLVICLAVGFLVHYTHVMVVPLSDALECTCISQGDKCREATVFSPKFWHQYWMNDVPTSIKQINVVLKGSFKAMPDRSRHSAVNLLKYHHSAQHAMAR